MKRTTPLLAVILCLMSLSGFQSAWAKGGDSSGGADRPTLDDGSAWFLGRGKQITACYSLAPGFEADSAQVEADIQNAFGTWKKYIQDKKVFDSRYQGQQIDDEHIAAVDVVLSNSCSGSEDLKFYFASSSAEVEKAKAKYDSPVAFAERTEYDLTKGWGKGFIWIAPSKTVSENNPPIWSFESALRGVLLHEVGHVLGNAHVSGTIMDENIAQMLLDVYQNPTAAQGRLSSIDRAVELVNCDLCDIKYQGRLDAFDNPSQEQKTFTLFMGRSPVGQIQANFHQIVIPTKTSIVGLQGFSLTLADSKGSKEFSIETLGPSTSFFSSVRLFATANSGSGSALFGSTGAVFSGAIRAANDQKLLVTVTHNGNAISSTSPYQITYWSNGKQIPLFYQVLPGSCYAALGVTCDRN